MTEEGPSTTRRDAITTMALGFAAVGALTAAWPLIDQMNPNRASPSDRVEVDLTAFDAERLKLVEWRREPYFIRSRTPDEIALARSVHVSSLRDPLARVMGIRNKAPASDDNLTKMGFRQWLVVSATCTRCNCLLKDTRLLGFDADEAFFCACCASLFDLAGRVKAGPARQFRRATIPFRPASKARIGASRDPR